MQPGEGVGAVLGDQDRLALGGPRLELGLQRLLGRLEVAGVHVPAVVAVEHDDVAQRLEPVPAVRREHMLTVPDRPGRVELPGQRRTAARSRRPTRRCRTPARWRCSTARRSGGSCRGRRARGSPARAPPGRCRRSSPARRSAGTRRRRMPGHHAEVLPDRGRLVDDDDAVPVGVVQHLLGVGVVRRAERVGADPVHQREVVHHQRVVVALAADGGVLVLAEAGEGEGLAVDQELRARAPRRCGRRPAACSCRRRSSPSVSSTRRS